jgi:hypothetical protein
MFGVCFLQRFNASTLQRFNDSTHSVSLGQAYSRFTSLLRHAFVIRLPRRRLGEGGSFALASASVLYFSFQDASGITTEHTEDAEAGHLTFSDLTL